MSNKEAIILIGYSGHAYVVVDIFHSMGKDVWAYCDAVEKINNPYNLEFLGKELVPKNIEILKRYPYFVAVGNNQIRKRIYENLSQEIGTPINAIHANAVVSSSVKLGNGVMICPNSVINTFAKIGDGVICNTACIIEHECTIGDYAHIAPGSTLAGNVTIGAYSFIGANSVVKQGVKIGKDVTVGAGCVVIKDIPDGVTVVGNPAKIINSFT